jgi:hypothetical protein
LPVKFDDLCPAGAYVNGEVEPVTDFDPKPKQDDHKRDKETGLRLWEVRVNDADPEARKGKTEVMVKIPADHRPVPPELMAGTPFRPVEFDGMALTPYVGECGQRSRLAYSI